MLDSVVARGEFHTRAEAVRAGIQLIAHDSREARITASYRSAYTTPLSDDETQMLDAAVSVAGDAWP